METINIGARFAPTPTSIREARQFVVEQAQHAPVTFPNGVIDDLALLVSELATNAVLHARTPFAIDLSIEPDVVRVAVDDESPDLPHPRVAGVEATTGRGLLILESLADRWGVKPLGPERPGKRVWFERALASAPPRSQLTNA